MNIDNISKSTPIEPECDKLAEEVAKDGNCLPHCGGQNFDASLTILLFTERFPAVSL